VYFVTIPVSPVTDNYLLNCFAVLFLVN